jgi:RecA/RadA recombinase
MTKLTKKKEVPQYNMAQQMAAILKKEHGKDFCDIILDPEAPLQVAENWVVMPAPWPDLTQVSGIPCGHITSIEGPPDSGKTTIAMHTMVAAQEQGFYVMLIDTEHKFNLQRFSDIGGDVSNFLHCRVSSLEEGFDRIEKGIQGILKAMPDAKIHIVWDSIGMTPTLAELEKGTDAHHVGVAARVIKLNIRKMVQNIRGKKVSMVFVNHLYDNIKAMFGDSKKAYGGKGIGYSAVLVIQVSYVGKRYAQKNGKKYIRAIRSKLKVEKNHLSAAQGEQREVDIGLTGIEIGKKKVSELAEPEVKELADNAAIGDIPLEEAQEIV